MVVLVDVEVFGVVVLWDLLFDFGLGDLVVVDEYGCGGWVFWKWLVWLEVEDDGVCVGCWWCVCDCVVVCEVEVVVVVVDFFFL